MNAAVYKEDKPAMFASTKHTPREARVFRIMLKSLKDITANRYFSVYIYPVLPNWAWAFFPALQMKHVSKVDI